MLRSLVAAISALRNHQTFMDVIANNIGNVNTPGFKYGTVGFQDLLNQTIRGGSAPQGGRGGINPEQVGLGMALGSINQNMSQGDLQPTGKITDLAIQGEGFFILNDGVNNVFSRDGHFDVGSDGTLVNSANGFKVQGYTANDQGVVDVTKATGDIVVPLDSTIPAVATSTSTLTGNLDSGAIAGAGSLAQATIGVIDPLGTSTNLSLQFTKTADNTWTVTAPAGSAFTVTGGPLVFNGNAAVAPNLPGRLLTPTPATLSVTNGTQTFAVDVTQVTQFSQTSSVNVSQQNGRSAGSLLNFTISGTGEIIASFSNGANRVLAQIGLSRFSNPSGLNKLGGNTYELSTSSGLPLVGLPDSGGRGQLASGVLEMSNVNLAQQFTQMIMAQRGFQANAKLVTTSDELLQDLINLKR